jgi:hypothetical protein
MIKTVPQGSVDYDFDFSCHHDDFNFDLLAPENKSLI